MRRTACGIQAAGSLYLVSGPPGPSGCTQPADVPQGAPDVTEAFQVMAQCPALGPPPFGRCGPSWPQPVGRVGGLGSGKWAWLPLSSLSTSLCWAPGVPCPHSCLAPMGLVGPRYGPPGIPRPPWSRSSIRALPASALPGCSPLTTTPTPRGPDWGVWRGGLEPDRLPGLQAASIPMVPTPQLFLDKTGSACQCLPRPRRQAA